MNSLTSQTIPMRRRQKGMGLLDVVLAVVIFAIGMLALASLQTNITRSSVDSNARTVALNLAEQVIEGYRSFEELRTEVDKFAYQDIVTETLSFTVGGTDYTVAVDVEEWYFLNDRETLVSEDNLPEGFTAPSISDFKQVDLQVTWAGSDFNRGDGETVGRLDSGDVSISSVIPAVPVLGAAKIATDHDGIVGGPPVQYTPGQRPDVVAITLESNSKFKESTTPLPDVIRSDELTETWFDVITYSTDNSGSEFLRREEFLVVSCECELMAPDSSNEGLMPTVWEGTQYSDERWATKPYGVSANNQQGSFCDTCCRDHHEGSTINSQDDVYDPARSIDTQDHWSEGGGPGGDHKHYKRVGNNNNTGLQEAGYGDTYVEACRMVRKDGFMRVAQDFRQGSFIGFPEGYLNTESGVTEYSGYVTTAVGDYYDITSAVAAYAVTQNALNPPSTSGYLPGDYHGDFPAGDPRTATSLPFLFGAEFQQMRARGVYVDQLGTKAAALVDCLRINSGDGDACDAPGVSSIYEVLPFYDVQTTWLNWWNMNNMSDPVIVSNEAVADNNGHSRGLAEMKSSSAQQSGVEVDLDMHRGNIGLTVTDDITTRDALDTSSSVDKLYIDVDGLGGEPPVVGFIWEATTESGVNQVNFSDIVITENENVVCSRSSGVLSCFTPEGEGGSITLQNYVWNSGNRNNPVYEDLYICVTQPDNPVKLTVTNVPDGINNSAEIEWTSDLGNLTGVTISIETSCL